MRRFLSLFLLVTVPTIVSAAAGSSVTYHVHGTTYEGYYVSPAAKAPLIMHGTADSSVTMDQFAALAVELEAAGIDHEMITYGGAQHAFTVFGTNRYHEDADRKSWNRFVDFLTDTLK